MAFEIEYNGTSVQVTEHSVGEQQVFRVAFERPLQPLVITHAEDRFQRMFWTSIPQGRQKEAEEIGRLIEHHFKRE